MNLTSVSVVIPTLVRESLYPLILALAEQDLPCDFELVLVCQPPGRLQRHRLPDGLAIKILEADLGLGFGYYRKMGSDAARGQILAWIDDDELPLGRHWLKNLINPILQHQSEVVTAGTYIPLGQGYWTDCISWLGLPGGAYPGFATMWPVDRNKCTNHLCSGNFAITAAALAEVGGFSPEHADGNEDTDLSDRLHRAGKTIVYQRDATVQHEARSGMRQFVRWQIQRGAAHKTLLSQLTIDDSGKSKVAGRLKSSVKIIGMSAKTRYFPGVVFMTGLQYLCQFIGYMNWKRSSRYT